MRFTVFDRWGEQIGVLTDIISAIHTDELNGEDSLSLTLASCDLVKGNRIVWQDKFGVWHEHIVNDLKAIHEDGRMYTVAYCENSLAELFTDYIEDLRPYNVSATVALQRALSVTRWAIGTVDVATIASASFYHISAREALSLITQNWGGELSATIQISGTQVSARKVNVASRGSDYGKRFEWTKDLRGITRDVSTEDVCTALYGYGKGLEAYDEDGQPTGGYERKLTFGEINGGRDYVADEDARLIWGVPDGSGGVKHAFGKVEFSDCEDMAELLKLTRAELQKRKQPQVSYSASVIDLADAGYEFEDVRTGDTVAIIDRELGERLSGRVLCVKRDLFNESATEITLGNIVRTIHDVISEQLKGLYSLRDHSAAWDGAASISESYINGVIRIWNDTMNATGGYVYQEPGEGITVYDKPEDQNPTMAIQLKGAGFRIANSKTPSGDWDWRTFGTGEGFTADLLNLGTLRGGSTYFNLETGYFYIDPSTNMGGRTLNELLEGVDAAGIDKIEYGTSSGSAIEPDSWSTTAPASVAKGAWLWVKTTYNDGSTTVTKAYAGTDGTNGTDGTDGVDGDDGIGIASIVPQYYLSTSSANATGGSWSTTPPTWSSGRYIWTRSLITWDTTPATTSTTTEVYDAALTQACSDAAKAIDEAKEAAKVATNYLTFDSGSGLDVGYAATNAKTRIKGNGVEIFDPNGNSALFAGIQDGNSIVRVGKASGSGNAVMNSDGSVDLRSSSTRLAHFGYGTCKDYLGNTGNYPYYLLGTAADSFTPGYYSLSGGVQSKAGPASIAYGFQADSSQSNGGFAFGNYAKVTKGDLAVGTGAEANAAYASAIGLQVLATGTNQLAIGAYNATNTNHRFTIGNGSYGSRANIFYVDKGGNVWCKGTLTQNSDRRLKEHHAYLGEDAAEFIRKLKPALFTKDGERHLGFYAQDVQEADAWDTATVVPQHTDESLDFDPLTLDYTALIAPLTAYVQSLENRLEEQQGVIDGLIGRIGRLEEMIDGNIDGR